MKSIDRNSPIPLYYQVKQSLLEYLENGTWKPGDLVPSEQELQEAYGVSRITVRQALSELTHEGRLSATVDKAHSWQTSNSSTTH